MRNGSGLRVGSALAERPGVGLLVPTLGSQFQLQGIQHPFWSFRVLSMCAHTQTHLHIIRINKNKSFLKGGRVLWGRRVWQM